MLRQNSQPEEPKKLYVWPWEEEICSPAEYMRALHGLNHFLKEVDIGQLVSSQCFGERKTSHVVEAVLF